MRVADALAISLLEAREDEVGGINLAGVDHVVETHAPGLELGNVAREEVAPLAVEEVEVAIVDLA